MADSDLRAWLEDHINLERGVGVPDTGPAVPAPTLDRIRALVELLGTPQHAYPVVHVTGTNGKTSTARMCAGLLAARGLSVGLYTSPHLARVNERLERNGEPIRDEDLDDVLAEVRQAEEHMDERPSYFEILTAAAFSWFADVPVDVAVLEVGLGGTWDATNVAEADVAVVTNIGVDHVEYLGPTRRGIAKEKAGIVKEDCALVLGETDPELVPLFTEAARPRAVRARPEDFDVVRDAMAHNGRMVALKTPGRPYQEVFLPFHGAHQAANAACALTAVEAFFGGEALDDDVVREAFAAVEIPGRLEVVGRQPLVLLDGAHNAAGARALRAALSEEFPTDELTLVVGLLREKEPHDMLGALEVGSIRRLVACRPPSPRAMEPEALAAAARDLGMAADAVEVVELVPEAVARALATAPPDGQVVVTGSLYTVGAARAALVP